MRTVDDKLDELLESIKTMNESDWSGADPDGLMASVATRLSQVADILQDIYTMALDAQRAKGKLR